MKFILHFFILVIAVYILPYVLSGIHVDTFLTALVVGAVLGFINITIKPILKLITLPINIITLGLFSLVLNGLFLWFIAKVISGFSIDNFAAACWGALIVAVINWVGNKLVERD